ncbi:hypothetical protein ABTK63_20645, partial [Acinetobacter baumannii]
MASVTASPRPTTPEQVSAAAASRRRPRRTRYRRRLRSRLILAFALLGFSLTLLLAYSANWVRNRVEDELVLDVMNR